MRSMTVMLKPASSLCNMRCRYCFYADEAAKREIPSYGLMSADTLGAVLEKVLAEACFFVYWPLALLAVS